MVDYQYANYSINYPITNLPNYAIYHSLYFVPSSAVPSNFVYTS